jgi:hypothetical protein
VLGADGALLGELDEESSSDIDRMISQQSPQGAVIDPTVAQRFRTLQVKPVIQRPAYLLQGLLVALIADPNQSAEVPEGRLPALVPLGQVEQSNALGRRGRNHPASLTPCEGFGTNSEDGIIRVGEAFWKLVDSQSPADDKSGRGAADPESNESPIP